MPRAVIAVAVRPGPSPPSSALRHSGSTNTMTSGRSSMLTPILTRNSSVVIEMAIANEYAIQGGQSEFTGGVINASISPTGCDVSMGGTACSALYRMATVIRTNVKPLAVDAQVIAW